MLLDLLFEEIQLVQHKNDRFLLRFRQQANFLKEIESVLHPSVGIILLAHPDTSV